MVCKSYTHAQRECPAATVMTLDDPVLNAQASSTGGGLPASLTMFSVLIMPLYFLLKTMTSGLQHLLLGDRKTTMFAVTFFCMLMVIAVDAAHPDISAHIASNATISQNLAYQCFTQNHSINSNDSQKSNIDSCDDFEWCIDSGCNRFVTNNMHDFIPGSVKYSSTNVSVGNGNTVSPCTGSVVIHSIPHNTNIQCDNVLFMPQCKKKLIPATPFIRQNYTLTFDSNIVTLYSNDHKRMILSGKEINNLYYFNSRTLKNVSHKENFHSKNYSEPTTLFGLPTGRKITPASQDFARGLLESHWAHGHLNFNKLRKLLGLKAGDNPQCAACDIADSKQRRLRQKHIPATRPYHRLFMDIGYTQDSNVLFQLYLDDYDDFTYIDIMTSKGQAFDDFVSLKTHLDNVYAPWKLAYIHTDCDTIYLSNNMKQYCRDQGLGHEFSSRYRHDQNHKIERAMGTIGFPFRAMMIQGNAPKADIPFALRHANVMRNHAPSTPKKGWTPSDRKAGMKLPLNKRLMAGPLFCLVFVHIYKEERGKNDPRGAAAVYLGFDDINNTYLVKDWMTGQIFYTADVTFHPNVFPYRANPQRTAQWIQRYDHLAPRVATDAFDEYQPPLPDGVRGQEVRPPGPSEHQSVQRPSRRRMPSGQALRNIPDRDIAPQDVHLTETFTVNNTTFRRNFPLHVFTMEDITYRDDFDLFYITAHAPDPKTWKQAMESEFAAEWTAARLSEQNSFKEHGVLTIVPREHAQGHRILRPKAVFKTKRNPPTLESPGGSVEKWKYRLTIQAFTRMLRQGIDYAEKHAAQVRWASLKIMFALAVLHDWDIVLWDIRTFFLYGKFHPDDPPVFMEQEDGWDTEDQPKATHIAQVHRTMYGHPAASNRANIILKETLTDGAVLKSTKNDDCVYTTTDHDSGFACVGSHVDDLPATGDSKGLAKIQELLEGKFKLTRKINPDVITGVQLERKRGKDGTLKIHQADYIEGVLKTFDMDRCTAADSPIDPGTMRAVMELPTDKVQPSMVKKYQDTTVRGK